MLDALAGVLAILAAFLVVAALVRWALGRRRAPRQTGVGGRAARRRGAGGGMARLAGAPAAAARRLAAGGARTPATRPPGTSPWWPVWRLAWYNTGTTWVTQQVLYPLRGFVGTYDAPGYQEQYVRLIQMPVVTGFALLLLATALLIWLPAAGGAGMVGLERGGAGGTGGLVVADPGHPDPGPDGHGGLHAGAQRRADGWIVAPDGRHHRARAAAGLDGSAGHGVTWTAARADPAGGSRERLEFHTASASGRSPQRQRIFNSYKKMRFGRPARRLVLHSYPQSVLNITYLIRHRVAIILGGTRAMAGSMTPWLEPGKQRPRSSGPGPNV